MLRMLVQNKVKDYDHWRSIFDENASSFDSTGLSLEWVRRNTDDPQEVWFCLLVKDRSEAEEYLADPIHAEVGQRAGVIDGHIFYLSDES